MTANFNIIQISLNDKETSRLTRSYAIESKPFVAEVEKAAKEQKKTTDEVYASILLKNAINDRFEDAQKRAMTTVEKAIETLKAQGMDVAAVALEAQLEAIKAQVKAEQDA